MNKISKHNLKKKRNNIRPTRVFSAQHTGRRALAMALCTHFYLKLTEVESETVRMLTSPYEPDS